MTDNKTHKVPFGTHYTRSDGSGYSHYKYEDMPTVTSYKKLINTPWEAALKVASRNPEWRLTYGMTPDLETANAVTGGVMNWTTPSQLIGFGADLTDDKHSFGDAMSRLITGNSGLVTDNFYQEHPYWSIAINGASDIVGFGSPKLIRGARPLVQKGLKQTTDFLGNHGIYDLYTTFGARFGNYGNRWDNFYGTLARRYNLPDKARTPEFLRKLDNPLSNKNGVSDLTGHKEWTNQPHTNFTTDRPVVSHSKGNWDDKDLYISGGDEVLKQIKPEDLKSIEPSDTFINGSEIKLPNNKITLISGDVIKLKEAQALGYQTLSSPRLRQIYENAVNNPEIDSKRFLFSKGPLYNLRQNKDYALEILRLQKQRGTPTLLDYRSLEKNTGLNAGVTDISELKSFKDWVNYIRSQPVKDSYPEYFYPNGLTLNIPKIISSHVYEDVVRTPYNKVFYQYASPAEFNWRLALKKGEPE